MEDSEAKVQLERLISDLQKALREDAFKDFNGQMILLAEDIEYILKKYDLLEGR